MNCLYLGFSFNKSYLLVSKHNSSSSNSNNNYYYYLLPDGKRVDHAGRPSVNIIQVAGCMSQIHKEPKMCMQLHLITNEYNRTERTQ